MAAMLRLGRGGSPDAPVDLVIFDCDGVLVDSERISLEVLVDVIRSAGGTIGEGDAYRRFLGRSMASVADILVAEFGLPITDAQLESMRIELYRRFRRDLKPIAGVAAAIGRIPLARCVASSGSVERIRLALGVTGLLPLFEPDIFSASMVPHGKPAPDLFLHAARAMGAPPGACLVIEDSPAGIEAARRAGMRVAAFTGGAHAEEAALGSALASLEPDFMFGDMSQLPQLVARG